jgi:hypothetical protein
LIERREEKEQNQVKAFLPVMVGQAWMIEQLSKIAPVVTVEGWQKDGNGTSQVRKYLKLVKKQN